MLWQILSNILNKHKMDYLVLGKVKSTWDGSTQSTDFETYIVDAKSFPALLHSLLCVIAL